MLKFVSKKEYWDCEDSKLVHRLPKAPFAWHLKNIQDAVAFSWLHEKKGERIAEIGGGDSRVLQVLKEQNEVFNVDNFEGLGNGPKEKQEIEGITVVPTLMGHFDPALPDASFDTVFSISVVEHVPDDQLDAFHRDCLRILKPGGLLLHLIDMYLRDEVHENVHQAKRHSFYRNWLYDYPMTMEDESQVLDPADLKFRCSYVTNPDNMMNRWNKMSPSLYNLRLQAQSVSLLFVARKA